MKKFALTGLALLTLGSFTFVSQPRVAYGQQPAAPQSPPADQPRHHRPNLLKQLSEALNLTDAQKAQIKPIIDTAEAKIKVIRKDATLTKEDKQAQIKPIRQQMEKDIKAVLTPEQLAKLKQLRAAQKAKRQQHQGQGGGGNNGPNGNNGPGGNNGFGGN